MIFKSQEKLPIKRFFYDAGHIEKWCQYDKFVPNIANQMKSMKLFPVCLAFAGALWLSSCGESKPQTEEAAPTSTDAQTAPPTETKKDPTSYDPKRGEGKFDESNVKVGAMDAGMATKGEGIANTKCTSCHKLTGEKLVGPGWKGVTERHKPHWIMNFITNPDPMIEKDPAVQAQLELCLVRMPNQNLTDDDARNIVEFMRKNDGAK